MAADSNMNDFQKMILALQEKRAQIDAAITNLLAASGALISEGGIGTPFSSESQPTELPRGAFLNKSLPAAVKLYLSAMKKKQSIREIATALREGGVESTSDNFESVITGCLNRMKSNGDVLRFKDGWALAEFYPESLRSRLGQDANPKKGAPGKKKTKKSSPAAKSTKTNHDAARKSGQSTAPASPPRPGVEQRIEEFARSRMTWFSAADILHAHPDIERRSLPLVLGRLAKKHSWIKGPDGKYREPE